MSRTFTINQQDGINYPRKNRKKSKEKKYFGERYGDGSSPHSKKNRDFTNRGYPMELRHHSVIKNKEIDELFDDEMSEIF